MLLANRFSGPEFAALADAKEVRKILADHDMKAESFHFSMGELRNSHETSIEWAREVGITQMITATLAEGNGGNSPTLNQVRRAADEYNKIAAVSAKAGLQQGLHNEDFERAMVDGKRTYDLLLDMLDPKLVKFQFQMSTITVGLVGAEDLPEVSWPFPLDAPAGHRQERSHDARGHRPQVAMGKGTIDWAKTFAAAKAGGVENYFVEQSCELTNRVSPTSRA